MKHIHHARQLSFALICALSLGACSRPLDNVGGNLSDLAQSQTVGESLVDELNASSTSATASDAVSQNAGVAPSSQGIAQASATKPPACVTVNPNPVVDSDADGVPDNATYTFNCNKTRITGGTTSITGTGTLSDPGVGFSLSLTNLKTDLKNADGSLAISSTRNGTRNATGSGSQITLNTNLNVQRQVTGSAAASLSNKLALTFTADAGSSIVQGQPLPSGTFSANGSYGWVRGSESYSFQVSTPTNLRYDATCGSELKITSGVLRATLQGTGANGFLRVTFNGCGATPSIIFLKN